MVRRAAHGKKLHKKNKKGSKKNKPKVGIPKVVVVASGSQSEPATQPDSAPGQPDVPENPLQTGPEQDTPAELPVAPGKEGVSTKPVVTKKENVVVPAMQTVIQAEIHDGFVAAIE